MPTHPQDTHLISDIQTQIQNLTHHHQNHLTILAGDFNRDILLKGRSSNGLITPPNPIDYEWTHFVNTTNLNPINNHKSFTRQGGHNYTSTSHIDCFYSNHPNINHLESHTITNLNQNSDHYPVQLQLPPNSIVIKETQPPPNNPRITYPIPPTNLQNLHATFLDKQNLTIMNLTQTLHQDQLTQTQWEEHNPPSKTSSTHSANALKKLA